MIDFTILRMGLCQDIAAVILNLMRVILMIRLQISRITVVELMNLWMRESKPSFARRDCRIDAELAIVLAAGHNHVPVICYLCSPAFTARSFSQFGVTLTPTTFDHQQHQEEPRPC
jgi:hypothetical protein